MSTHSEPPLSPPGCPSAWDPDVQTHPPFPEAQAGSVGEKRVRWLNITSAHTAPTLPHVCTPPAGGPAGQLPQEAEEEPGLVPLPPQHPPQKKGCRHALRSGPPRGLWWWRGQTPTFSRTPVSPGDSGPQTHSSAEPNANRTAIEISSESHIFKT